MMLPYILMPTTLTYSPYPLLVLPMTLLPPLTHPQLTLKSHFPHRPPPQLPFYVIFPSLYSIQHPTYVVSPFT